MMNRFSLCLIFVILILSFSTQTSFAQGCMDEPTEADIGAYPYYEEGYAYRYASSFPSYQEFGIVQWWGCCEPAGDFNILVTVVYGESPSLEWTNPDYGVDRGYDFTSKGIYVVVSTHPGFGNCTGTYSIENLTFFLYDDPNDLDADGTENLEDFNADGDQYNNDVDNDDDNDDIFDSNDSTPGGPGTSQYTWPVAWGGLMEPTPTPVPTPTNSPTPTNTPTPTPDCCQKAITDLNWNDDHGTRWYCLYEPHDCTSSGQCSVAWYLSGVAQDWASDTYPTDFNKQNAAMHVYWNLRMVEEFGPGGECPAKQISDAYEVDEPNNCSEMYKDLWNNKVGRDLAGLPGSIESRIQNKFDDGTIHIEPGC